MMQRDNNIALCGFMGCGKSFVGRRLAKALHRRFIDLDRYIVEQEEMQISEIFARFGEDRFRDIEYEAVCTLSKEKGLVIGLGGGTALFDRNVERMHQESTAIVFLQVPFPACYGRIKNDPRRPIAQQNSREDLEKIYYRRLPLYRRAANIIVKGSGDTKKVIDEICAGLSQLEKNAKG